MRSVDVGGRKGADGTLGVFGSVVDAAGQPAGFVAWISPDGSSTQVWRTPGAGADESFTCRSRRCGNRA